MNYWSIRTGYFFSLNIKVYKTIKQLFISTYKKGEILWN